MNRCAQFGLFLTVLASLEFIAVIVLALYQKLSECSICKDWGLATGFGSSKDGEVVSLIIAYTLIGVAWFCGIAIMIYGFQVLKNVNGTSWRHFIAIMCLILLWKLTVLMFLPWYQIVGVSTEAFMSGNNSYSGSMESLTSHEIELVIDTLLVLICVCDVIMIVAVLIKAFLRRNLPGFKRSSVMHWEPVTSVATTVDTHRTRSHPSKKMRVTDLYDENPLSFDRIQKDMEDSRQNEPNLIEWNPEPVFQPEVNPYTGIGYPANGMSPTSPNNQPPVMLSVGHDDLGSRYLDSPGVGPMDSVSVVSEPTSSHSPTDHGVSPYAVPNAITNKRDTVDSTSTFKKHGDGRIYDVATLNTDRPRHRSGIRTTPAGVIYSNVYVPAESNGGIPTEGSTAM